MNKCLWCKAPIAPNDEGDEIDAGVFLCRRCANKTAPVTPAEEAAAQRRANDQAHETIQRAWRRIKRERARPMPGEADDE